MRVIAGSAGGIQLQVPKRGVRPTMDRVKGAIFSSLGDEIVGARVLDLFSGSGALGIEALSRGASSVLFVDEDRQAVATIEKNLAKTKLSGRIQQHDVFKFLKRTAVEEKFRIIFADPPYEKMKSGEKFTARLLTDESLPQLLQEGGVFVLEKQPSESVPETPFWNAVRRKTYGATEVLFFSSNSQSSINASPARTDPQSIK
jgi:16S rRNA (guanine966-N2)-methyltransferase